MYMKEKILAFNDESFIFINVLKLLAKYDIHYNIYPSLDGQEEIAFHVINKDTGEKISDLIFLFVEQNVLHIESFYPNLHLQKDSKGLSAALAYLLMALYGALRTKSPIKKIHIRAERTVANTFWKKLKGFNLVETGKSILNPDYYEYAGVFPESELKPLYRLALLSIKKSAVVYPFFKVTPPSTGGWRRRSESN